MLPSFEIQQNKQLRDLHTFAVPWRAQFFVSITDNSQMHDVLEIARGQSQSVFVLGGGSNILPISTYKGLVIQNNISGRTVVSENDDEIVVEFGAGENWHDTVLWCVEHGYHGIENLALIPGTVGGAVVQNIGAYDCEISQNIVSVSAVDRHSLESRSFTQVDCQFEYRNSIFKKNQGAFVVTAVQLRLQKKYHPIVTYDPLKKFTNQPNLTAKDVVDEIITIRKSKLPDWETIGTAGSFFGNPRVEDRLVRKLLKKYKEMPVFTDKQTGKKIIPAGWLIEHSKLDSKVREKFLYSKHSLVLVNNQKGDNAISDKYGKEIYHASKMIVNRVEKDFWITLEREVLIVE